MSYFHNAQLCGECSSSLVVQIGPSNSNDISGRLNYPEASTEVEEVQTVSDRENNWINSKLRERSS